MSSFFTTPPSQRKRKRPEASTATSSKRRSIGSAAKSGKPQAKTKTRQVRDESISDNDDSGDDDGGVDAGDVFSGSEGGASSGGEDETADERRLRLAQRYLDNIREEVQEDPYAFDAAEVDRDYIAERLKEDVAEGKGKLHRHVAEEYDFSAAERTFFTADQNGVTGVAVILPHAFTVSNDGTISKWELASPQSAQSQDGQEGEAQEKRPTNIASRKRPKLIKRFYPPAHPKPTYQGHTSAILCIAASSSGNFLATGGADRKLVVWDPTTLKPLKYFNHHRDKVLSLSFRRGTHTLYTASADRTCKVFELDNLAYVQTLFGHQDQVTGIAGCADEKFVSVGARDRTARLFKVVEEQQLVFRGGGGGAKDNKRKDSANGLDDPEADSTKYEEGSIDHVTYIDEETFVTGSDNGSISLWSVLRKKPVFTVPLAHGADEPLELDEAYAEEEGEIVERTKRPGRRKPRWITALASIPLADVVLTGSWDGYVRVWKITKDRRRIEALGVIGREDIIPTPDARQIDDEPETDGQVTGHRGESSDKTYTGVPVKGIINSLSLVERSTKTQFGTSSASTGLCVVAAVSKRHRLGKWELISKKDRRGVRNGAVVFEVPRRVVEAANLEDEQMEDEE